jgi:hypothetical protein
MHNNKSFTKHHDAPKEKTPWEVETITTMHNK